MVETIRVSIWEPDKHLAMAPSSATLPLPPRPPSPPPPPLGDGDDDGGVSGKGGEGTDLEGNSAEALDGKHRGNLPQTRIMDLSVESSEKAQALGRMETGEEKYPKWQSEHTLRLQRAWVVHSAWASIENVCIISSSILVNKLQCEHIADHFKVIGYVLKKLGLDKDFFSGEVFKGGSSIQINITYDEMHFSRVAETFGTHIYGRDFENLFLKTRIQVVSRMFEDYISKLRALDGSSWKSLAKSFQDFGLRQTLTKTYGQRGQSYGRNPFDLLKMSTQFEHDIRKKLFALDVFSEEPLSKQSKINEVFQDFSLLGMSTQKNVKAQSLGHKQGGLDDFLCHLLGVLKEGEDLVLFHSGLEGANTGVARRTGLYGEKFVEIHELLYKLLDFYACLEHCEGTEFAWGWLSKRDSCRAQSLLYYLNSNCLDEERSLSIDDDFLNIELAIRISELLKRPNCALKRLDIDSSSSVEVNQEELRKCRLLVIAALSECMSITHLFVTGSNGEEVHDLCKSLSVNEVLEYLFISSDEALADNDAMNLSAMLKEKHNVEGFSLRFKGVSSKGAVYLGAMLAKNSSLEKMSVTYRVLDKIDSKHLLRPSKAISDQEPHVYVYLNDKGYLYVALELSVGIAGFIAQILSTSKTLTHIYIFSMSSNSDVACEILDSLKRNKTLQVLELGHLEALNDAQVKIAFMDLLVNYNFSLGTIRMRQRDWDIQTFLEFELEPHMKTGDLRSIVDGTSESPIVCSAHDLKQALEDFQLEEGKGSTIEVHGSPIKAFEERQEELVIGHSSKPKVISGLKSKLEMEFEQSLQELKPLLESVMKSTNFCLRRNLNMAQFLQERYTQWNSFVEMHPSKLTDEEKDECSKGCITAALFPKTFLYHLKVHLLQGKNPRGILHRLKEVADLVVQSMKSLQDSKSQTFQFIDYVDFQAPLNIQHIYSPRETIAICQTYSTGTRFGEELQANISIQYGIVQDYLTGAYYFESDKSSNLNKPNLDKSAGVIGVKVTSTDIHVEIMWEDGSYYSGVLEDFSYDFELGDNKQCALEAFGDLKGAHFLRTCGLKCSPLLIIALAMAIDKKGLALTWSNGKGHIESNSLPSSVQPIEMEVWECQILFGGDTNQLGEAVEWGMNQFDQDYASSSRNNKYQVFLERKNANQNFSISNDTSMDTWSSDGFNDISNHSLNNVDLGGMLASQYNAGAQNKLKISGGVKILGFGIEAGGEMKNSKGKKVEDQAYTKMQDLHWKERGGYVIVDNLNDEHRFLEQRLFQGSLYAEPDLNYLVVYDEHKESHVSVYWVKERNDKPRFELKWITDIFIEGGLKRIKEIFRGLKGETLEVSRTGTKFLETQLQHQPKGLVKSFMNRLSNKGNCKDIALQMVATCEGNSNDEWKHIVGLQPNFCSNNFWWKASYMQAITYSRTLYSSGVLLLTCMVVQYGLKCGRAQRKFGRARRKLRRAQGKLKPIESSYVHHFENVKSCAKFSKPPQSLSPKCHEMIFWGGIKET